MIRSVCRVPLARVLSLAIVYCLCLAAGPCLAATQGDLVMQAEDENAVTWQLNADTVSSHSTNEVLEATGNVVLRRGDDYLKADYARYFSATKWVYLRGNIEAKLGRDVMRSEEAEFDLRSRIGWLKNGNIFMDGPHLYLAGERIDKHWGDVYSFREAKVTACDDDVPAWSIEAAEAVVEIDGYAQLWKPRFQVKDTPLLIAPWMVIPAKKERQTGFLAPDWGQSSLRGFYWDQPFFWAIDESQDLMLNGYFMDKRGYMQGVEYRARPSSREMGWLRIDWLRDKVEVNDDVNDKVNDRDGLVRNNRDRYWLRGMYEGHFPDPRWKIRADVDYVSDQNYLHEFKSGNAGYRRSRDVLFDLFSRDLNERDQLRQSGLMVFRDWDRVSLALSARYYQNQNLGNGNAKRDTDTTVQYLPELNLFLNKGGIVEGVPLEVAASLDTTYMYRRNGTRGMRYMMTPMLSVPLNGRYGSLIASASVQQSFYGTDTYSKSTDDEDRQTGESQTVPTIQLDASTELDRVYRLAPATLTATKENVGKNEWTAVRHAIQPRVQYRNVPLKDQHKNPYYTKEDRIRPINELTYSVTNVLTRKRNKVVAQKVEGSKEPVPAIATDYLEFLRFSLEQSYDIREAERTDERKTYERRPLGDVIGEFTISLDEFISLTSRSYWSPYIEDFTRHDHGATFRMPGWGRFYTGLGYRKKLDEYTRERDESVKTIQFSTDFDFLGPLSLGIDYSHDYERSESVDRRVRLTYTHQCFQLIGHFGKDGYDEYYGISIALMGLGS